MIIKRQKEFVQAAALTIPYQTTFPVQEQTTVTQNKAPRFLRKARVSVYKTGKGGVTEITGLFKTICDRLKIKSDTILGLIKLFLMIIQEK